MLPATERKLLLGLSKKELPSELFNAVIFDGYWMANWEEKWRWGWVG